jgi:hypothetical protein
VIGLTKSLARVCSGYSHQWRRGAWTLDTPMVSNRAWAPDDLTRDGDPANRLGRRKNAGHDAVLVTQASFFMDRCTVP